MALTSEEIEQVRVVMRNEMGQQRNYTWVIVVCVLVAPVLALMVVLLLHVLIIGGFTVYHLMHSPS